MNKAKVLSLVEDLVMEASLHCEHERPGVVSIGLQHPFDAREILEKAVDSIGAAHVLDGDQWEAWAQWYEAQARVLRQALAYVAAHPDCTDQEIRAALGIDEGHCAIDTRLADSAMGAPEGGK